MNLLYAKTVDMNPFGKARPRVSHKGTYMPTDYVNRKEALAWSCADMPDLDGRLLALQVTAVRPMPKSWSEKKKAAFTGTPNTTTPDIDNIVGAVMDALFEKDSSIVEISALKVWGYEGQIAIKIFELKDIKNAVA